MATAPLYEILDVLNGKQRYLVWSDGTVRRSRQLKPLLHNGGKPRK